VTKAAAKILAYHLARLKDKNKQIRLQSIHELQQLNDPEALGALQDVFKNDVDPDVRKAAQEAGRAIFIANNVKSE
jgi:HEAT repeat protein